MTMRELTYQVGFNTPAFLGNAEQQAQWRTPPFKALLRQWWRVVKAPEVGYDHRRLAGLENRRCLAAQGMTIMADGRRCSCDCPDGIWACWMNCPVWRFISTRKSNAAGNRCR